jgi:hypothetical protein
MNAYAFQSAWCLTKLWTNKIYMHLSTMGTSIPKFVREFMSSPKRGSSQTFFWPNGSPSVDTARCHIHGLWTHNWYPIKFSLVVDDFGVMYVGREHAEHLKAALEENDEISTDWEGSLYCGIKLTWDYTARTVDLSMPGYIAAVLHRFQHPHPTRLQHDPYKMQPINYGAKVQFETPSDTTASLADA